MIKESIIENGWIRNPIVVNEKFEIIDGQGRFEALRELGLPIEYVVAPGADVRTCAALNVRQRNWSSLDFVKCYAEMEIGDYPLLLETIEAFDELTFETVVVLIGGEGVGSKNKKRSIAEGEFFIANPEKLDELLFWAQRFFRIIKKEHGRKGFFAMAARFIFEWPGIDPERMIAKMEKYPELLSPCANMKMILEMLEKIYNYNSRTERVFFLPEYQKWTRGMTK